jgi:oligopeptidase B
MFGGRHGIGARAPRKLASVAVGLAALIMLITSRAAAQEAEAKTPTPPAAEIVPKKLEKHGDIRVDDYYWLNRRDDPAVIAYLEAENDYTEAVMAHTKDLQAALFEEIKGRIKQTDLSVPYREGDAYYYSRTEDGQAYPIYARKKGSLEASEQVMLDVNELAEGHEFYAAAGRRVSSSSGLLAFAEDTVGRRLYTLRFLDLDTGDFLDEEIPGTSGGSAWAEDNRTIFYVKRDPGTLRPYQVYRHLLGTDPSKDELVYEEEDEEFSCYVWKTKSKRYVVISCSHTLADEHRFVDASQPDQGFRVFLPRERGHEHNIEHHGEHFYVRTNDGARNFRLMRTPVARTGKANWEDVIGARDEVLVEGFEVFRDHLVVTERSDGLRQMRIRSWSGDEEHYLDFGEPDYLTWVHDNPEMDTHLLRFGSATSR